MFMKYAVIGGAGFIGNNIARLLVKDGNNVKIIDNLHTGKKENLDDIFEKIEFELIDIRDFSKLKNALKDIDGIFHQAALTSVPESFFKPEEYFDVNVNGTKNIFKIANELNVKTVFASSSSVYGDVKSIPIKEDCSRNPINPYGKTKLDKEKLAKEFWEKNSKIIGLRYFNVYGKGQTGTYAGVISQFLNRLGKKTPPIINGNGSQIRDFVFVEDVAKANLYAMNSDLQSGFFNVGTGKTISILELAKKMISISGLDLEPEFDDELKGDIKESQADTTLIKKMIEWNHEIEIEEGLRKLMK